jgi:transcription elongation GreA/GreB family factor
VTPHAIDKAALKAELLAQLTAALASAEQAHSAAIEGATHTEARAENSKDTRGLEQSYLARGQAKRVAELTAGVADVGALALRTFGARDAIALSAVVTIEEAGAPPYRRFLAPAGGGAVLAGDVIVVTSQSPLGRALVGKHPGDDIEVALPGGLRTLTILAVV